MLNKISLPLALGAALFAFTNSASAQDTPPPPPPPKAEPQEQPAPPKAKPQEGSDRPRGERPRGDRPEGERGERRRRRGGGMEDLNLTDTQKAKMEAAMKAYREAIAGARESGDWNKMREARKTYEKIVNDILTDEQKKKKEEANRNRFGGRDGGRGRGGRGDGGRGFGRGRGEGGRGFGRGRGNPEERDNRMIEEVKKSLFLSKTQEEPVLASLKKILAERRKSRETIETKRRSFLKALKDGAKKEDAIAKLAEFRKVRSESEAAVKKLETELAGQLDDLQKAKLVAMGLLK